MQRLTLIATKVAPAGMAQGHVPNFAGAIPQHRGTDPGRLWAGDLYVTGPMTDPEEAFARFDGGDDTEAWLDRHDDGTLVGWVRQGADVWRYTDPRSWGNDVDAAEMTRTDAPSSDAAIVEPADATQMPSNQAGADLTPDLGAETPDEENPFLLDDTDVLDEQSAAENDAALDEQAAELGESPTPTDPNLEPPADAPVADVEDDDEDEDDPWKKVEKKHYPGHHDQADHGNWADGIHSVTLPTRSPAGHPGGGEGGPSGPKAPKPAAPAKAKIDSEYLDHLSDEDLQATWDTGQDFYDDETLDHLADLLDQRRPIDKSLRENLPDDHAGRAGAFSSVVPQRYITWVAQTRNANAPKQSRNQHDAAWEAYMQFVDAQYAAALEATNGYFWSKKGKLWRLQGQNRDSIDLFTGRIRRDLLRLYASEELLSFFATHPRLSFEQFKKEFFDKYNGAAQDAKNAYLSEFG